MRTRPVSLVSAFVSYTLVAWAGLWALTSANSGKEFLVFIVAAFFGVLSFVRSHHKTPGGEDSVCSRLADAVVLGLAAALFGFASHVAFAPWRNPMVTIPIGIAGSFVWPFATSAMLWRAMGAKR